MGSIWRLEKRDAILARADDYARNREVCGVHWPSDEAASRTVAYSMIGLILNHTGFNSELQAATVELRTLLGLAPASSPDKHQVTGSPRTRLHHREVLPS